MDLEFVERCKENSEFRGSHRDLFATNVAHDKWIKGELVKKCLNLIRVKQTILMKKQKNMF